MRPEPISKRVILQNLIALVPADLDIPQVFFGGKQNT
jgi:hypothetical protein